MKGNDNEKKYKIILIISLFCNLAIIYGANIKIDDRPIKNGSLIEAYTIDGTLCGKGKYNNGILKFMPVYGYDNMDPATVGLPNAGDNFIIHIDGQKSIRPCPGNTTVR